MPNHLHQFNMMHDLNTVLNSINYYAAKIHEIDTGTNHHSPEARNDALDQRDYYIICLQGLVETNTLSHPDGTISVYIGNGYSLIENGTVFPIDADAYHNCTRDRATQPVRSHQASTQSSDVVANRASLGQ